MQLTPADLSSCIQIVWLERTPQRLDRGIAGVRQHVHPGCLIRTVGPKVRMGIDDKTHRGPTNEKRWLAWRSLRNIGAQLTIFTTTPPARTVDFSRSPMPLAETSFRICAVAASALARSRAAPTTCAPHAPRETSQFQPRARLKHRSKNPFPSRSIPDKTSSVIDTNPNMPVVDAQIRLPCFSSFMMRLPHTEPHASGGQARRTRPFQVQNSAPHRDQR